jgi:hypothetical protein
MGIAGNTAVARVEICDDGLHDFTDFLSLYKFSQGWKISLAIGKGSFKISLQKKLRVKPEINDSGDEL